MILYRTTIIAITSSVWINPPVSIPGIIPAIPNTQAIIHITATNQSKFFISLFFDVIVLLHKVCLWKNLHLKYIVSELSTVC